jgi:hypothetical protein
MPAAVAAILIPADIAPPLRASAAFGALRCRVLDALLLGMPAEVPAPLCGELATWAQEQTASAQGPLLGLDPATVPAAWLDVLGWAGVPLARGGALHWHRDLDEGAVARPEVVDGRLALPPPATLAELSGVGLKPLRAWLGRRLGSRLQAAPGLRTYLWGNQALLVSRHDQPVGGFYYGPVVGNRTGLAIDPGAWQLVTW